MLLATYEKGIRKAEIHDNDCGYKVKLYEDNVLIDIINLPDNSIYYAEDCAENYINYIGSFC